jgi:hypothetical protein
MEADNDGGQRFYRRLGATLRPKVVATWAPESYEVAIRNESQAASAAALDGPSAVRR